MDSLLTKRSQPGEITHSMISIIWYSGKSKIYIENKKIAFNMGFRDREWRLNRWGTREILGCGDYLSGHCSGRYMTLFSC